MRLLQRSARRVTLGALVATTLAGCNAVANLSEFDSARVGPSDAAASSDADPSKTHDAAPTEEASNDAAGDVAATSEAGLDATIDDGAVSPEAGGEDATLADGGEADTGLTVDAGEDVEAEAGCTCSAYGVTSTTCYGPCAPVCGAQFGDCNASSSPVPDDGCETYLDSLTSCKASCGGTAVACGATDVCNAGVCGAPQGLTVFTVPLSATGQIQRYADRPASPWNLAGKTIFVRLYAPLATGGVVIIYLSDNNSNQGPSATVNLSQLATGWTDIELANIVDQPAVGQSGTFLAEQVKQVTMEVRSGSDTAWTNPTVVYVDSVWSSDVTIHDTFDTSIGNMVPSTQATVTGSTLTWQNSVSPPPVDAGSSDGDVADARSDDTGTD